MQAIIDRWNVFFLKKNCTVYKLGVSTCENFFWEPGEIGLWKRIDGLDTRYMNEEDGLGASTQAFQLRNSVSRKGKKGGQCSGRRRSCGTESGLDREVVSWLTPPPGRYVRLGSDVLFWIAGMNE